MKAMEPAAAPMISVPKGVLQEFVTNSPSPTPSIKNDTTVVDSNKTESQSRTPSPDLPNHGSDSALPTDPPSNHVVNGVSEDSEKENSSVGVSENNNLIDSGTSDSTTIDTESTTTTTTTTTTPTPTLPTPTPTLPTPTPTLSTPTPTLSTPTPTIPTPTPTLPTPTPTIPTPTPTIPTPTPTIPTPNPTILTLTPTPTTESTKDLSVSVNGESEKRLNGTLKRPSEQSEGSFPDLKKIRVFFDKKTTDSPPAKDKSNSSDAEDEIMCLSSNVVTKPEEKTADKVTPTKSIFDDLLPIAPKKEESKVLGVKNDNDPFSQEKYKLKGKLRTFHRKELEKLVLRLFSEKTLYQCELGRQKQLCEKLENTLEANRKKTAQFHKEIEDLKKVTNRLSNEQQARKGQYVAPIRIKRSVGIQAAPHIINKGLQHAQNNTVKTIAPRPGLVSSKPQGTMGLNRSQINTSSPSVVPSKLNSRSLQTLGGTPIMHSTASGSNTLGSITHPTTAGTISTVRPTTSPMMLMTQAAPGVIQQSVPRPAVAGRPQHALAGLPAPGTLVKVPAPTQLVAIPQSGVVLLPNASTGGAALVVSQVSGVQTVGNSIMATARMGTVSSPRVMGTSFKPVSTPTASAPVVSSVTRHPAPLPRTPVQQVAGITKKLPPQPTLKLSHKENSIVLSWTMAKTEDHETIASYQLYAYQEGNTPPSPALWKKVGSVKALELPMACTLTQFMPGHIYHFAVRAVDIKSRLGPFSEPRSIRLEGK